MQNLLTERRGLARHEVRVPIEIQQIGRGITHDISVNGIAFELDRLIEPGTPIEFHFALNLGVVQLHCVGHVVRVEQRGEKAFTAATIEEIDFVPREH